MIIKPSDQISTNEWVDLVGSTIDLTVLKTYAVSLKNIGENSIDYKILKSVDGEEFMEEYLGSVDTGIGTNYINSHALFGYYKIQIKSTVEDFPGEARVRIIAKQF